MVEMSNTHGPFVGQNGLSSAAKDGLTSEWYSAVANTSRRWWLSVSTWIWLRDSSHAARVAWARRLKDGPPEAPSRSRFLRACSTPRSEKPMRSSTVWPSVVGPPHMKPKGRSVVGRMWSKARVEPPGMSLRSYHSSWRQPSTSHSMWTARGAPSTTISPCMMPGSTDSRWARSGTVEPYGIASPPMDMSTMTRASGWAGNV